MPYTARDYLDAEEVAVYLGSVLGRPMSAAYVRVLAHRGEWRRTRLLGRVRYLLDDVDATLDRMGSPSATS